jgi:hypothetical protein
MDPNNAQESPNFVKNTVASVEENEVNKELQEPLGFGLRIIDTGEHTKVNFIIHMKVNTILKFNYKVTFDETVINFRNF